MKFTLKRVAKYTHASGLVFRRVWILSESGREIMIAKDLNDIGDAIEAAGGAA